MKEGILVDIIGDRARALALIDRRGRDHFLAVLDRLARIYHGIDCKIYKYSLEWLDGPRPLKARGIYGDLWIAWR
ncbi:MULTISPECIES: hypothetical protein [unclassified Frankia]|uniref:hypothetical protein n=1 Tax=unclassified Frankia TaxID=2632575 RepID=UPI002118A708|nr:MULTISPECIES: hypothetical protein [unclassified Frankia]